MGGSGRIQIEGPTLELPPREALSMTMAVCELVTNAAKYGALSTDGGKLSISWRVAQRGGAKMLEFLWVESQGPAVAPPAKQGFGTRLLARCIERDLGGRLTLDFAPLGVSCRIEIPIGEWVSHD